MSLFGFCENHLDGGSVIGEIEGESAEKIQEMLEWLKYRGSPKSKIEKLVKSEILEQETWKYTKFEIRK